MTAKEIVEAWLDTPCEDPLSEADCLRLENIIAKELADAQARALRAESQLVSSRLGLCEVHPVFEPGCMRCTAMERDALKATVERAREALRKAADTFADLQTASDVLGRTLVAESCRIAKEATLEALAALDAGKEAPPPTSYTVCVHCGGRAPHGHAQDCACRVEVRVSKP